MKNIWHKVFHLGKTRQGGHETMLICSVSDTKKDDQ